MCKYIIITWPDIQNLMDRADFNEHACLINDEKWVEKYGSAAYFVEEKWALTKCTQK